ncbi:hypothetical protein AALB39_08965 [Lachnospiraceae bacterium 54-53]
MDRIYDHSDSRMRDEALLSGYVTDTFKAFADAMIPRSPDLAEQYGRIQYYGALDLFTYEYLILSLDSLAIPLAIPTAQILNIAAKQFLYEKDENPEESDLFDGKLFSGLSPSERLLAAGLLLQPDGFLYFPALDQISQEDIYPVIPSLNKLALMGYYSEWSGYGLTRLNPPGQRTLEHFPVSWDQIGYPGPSLGYRVSRSYSYV